MQCEELLFNSFPAILKLKLLFGTTFTFSIILAFRKLKREYYKSALLVNYVHGLNVTENNDVRAQTTPFESASLLELYFFLLWNLGDFGSKRFEIELAVYFSKCTLWALLNITYEPMPSLNEPTLNLQPHKRSNADLLTVTEAKFPLHF